MTWQISKAFISLTILGLSKSMSIDHSIAKIMFNFIFGELIVFHLKFEKKSLIKFTKLMVAGKYNITLTCLGAITLSNDMCNGKQILTKFIIYQKNIYRLKYLLIKSSFSYYILIKWFSFFPACEVKWSEEEAFYKFNGNEAVFKNGKMANGQTIEIICSNRKWNWIFKIYLSCLTAIFFEH